MTRRLWGWLFRSGSRFGRGVVVVAFIAGGAAGLLALGGLNIALDYTNTMDFCISCHEMEENVYQEYKRTIHYNNRTGVRTTCADCHVPRPWLPKLIAKTIAVKDLYHHFLGTLDTPEKFEERRLEMAERVWDGMRASDSRECRNCHAFEAMDFHRQTRRAREKMEEAMKKNRTCIDCHEGVAHTRPDDD